MARPLALLAGIGLILVSVMFAGASTASAKGYVHEGWYPTKADCESAGQDWGDPFICVDDPAHSPPWDLLVMLP